MLTATQERALDAECARERIEDDVLAFVKQHSGGALTRRGHIAANLGYTPAAVGRALRALSDGGLIQSNGHHWQVRPRS